MSKNEKTYHSDEDSVKVPEVLKNVNKTSPFTIPDKYFEGLPMEILDRVSTQEQKGVRYGTLFSGLQRRMLIPVLSVILIVGLFFIFNRDNSTEDEFQFTGISLGETLDQYPAFFKDMDEDLLIEVLITSSENIDDPTSTIWSDSTITQDEILNYIEEEDIDVEYLYNL